MGWTFISFTFVRNMRMRCRSSSRTDGPARSIEQLKIIDPLTNPTAHGASASDAFHVVIPSMPGYGFSGKPTTTGWDPARIARAWVELMKRLGYDEVRRARRRLGRARHECDGSTGAAGIARHSHQHARHGSARDCQGGPGRRAAARRPLSRREARVRAAGLLLSSTSATASRWARARRRYTGLRIRPSAWRPGCSTTTRAATSSSHASFDGQPEGLTRDDVLDNITLFWLTNTAISSARLYWENKSPFSTP